MKRNKLYNILLMISLLIPLMSNAQSNFDKYENNENITSVIVNKKMFELMGKVKMESKEDQAYLNLIKKLDHLRVYKTSNPKITADMRTNVDKYSENLQELMRVNENGRNSKIYVKSSGGSSTISELLMYIEGTGMKGSDTVLMLLTGNFSIDELSLLTKRLNLPGGEDLSKAAKK